MIRILLNSLSFLSGAAFGLGALWYALLTVSHLPFPN